MEKERYYCPELISSDQIKEVEGKMKDYVKPVISHVIFTSVEKFAGGVSCHIGECHDATGAPIWIGLNGPAGI
ncbi:MAG TPA: hypothetical protein VN426_09190 [Syntrophomonadaceae bacterium]|nr:hypothetical protein [Syntrophomonadaceae bacterium]